MPKGTVPLEDMKKYELMVIIDADIGEAAIKKQLEKLRKQIEAFDGTIHYEEMWGLRNLAYSIKKRRQGYYAILDFMALPEHLREFDRTMRLDTDILRHMLSVLPKHYEPKDYVKEAEVEALKEAALKEEKAAAKDKRMGITRPPVKAPEAVKAPEPVKATVKTEAPEKKKVPAQSLEDIDKKLESIIDNPDIKL